MLVLVPNLVNAQRSGKMTFQLDVATNTLNFIDDHDYQGDTNYETAITFTASTVNTNGQTGVDTIVVSMLNSTVNDNGKFNYKIKVLG